MSFSRAEFEAQGYTLLRGVIGEDCRRQVREECEALVEEVAGQLAGSVQLTQTFAEAPFEKRLMLLYRDLPDQTPTTFRQQLHRRGFFGLFAHPALLEVAEEMLGPELRLYPNYSVRPKLPRDPRTEVLWHQDAGYTSGESQVLRMVNVWTPLVRARVENGCMQFVAGSHRQGVVEHEKDQHYLRIPDRIIAPLASQVVNVEMDPGDVVFFSNLLFHRGLPNEADHVRWSLDFS